MSPIEQLNQKVETQEVKTQVPEVETTEPTVEQPTEAKTNKAKTKGRKPIPKNETAIDRFKRLANGRVPKAVKSLRLIENLFTGAQYNWTTTDGQAVVEAISKIVGRIQDRAENAGKSTEATKFQI